MKSSLATLRSLVLPFGTTSGQRIELDGDTGDIRLYDTNGKLRMRIGDFQEGIEFFTGLTTGIGGEANPALIYAQAVGVDADATRAGKFILSAPQMDSNSRPEIELRSQSFNGANLSFIQFTASDFMFVPDDATADLLYDTFPLPRGIIKKATKSTNQGSITAETDVTGLSVTWTARSDHQYRLVTHARGCTSDIVNDRARVSITDSSNNHVGADADIPITIVNVVFPGAHDEALVSGISGSVTYKVRCARAAGTGNVTYAAAPGAGSGGAFLTVEDLGRIP